MCMTKKQRRQSQNGRLMREILNRLREYDVEEVRLLCEKYKQRTSLGCRSSGRRRRPQS